MVSPTPSRPASAGDGVAHPGPASGDAHALAVDASMGHGDEPGPLAPLQRALFWALPVALVVMQLVDLRDGVHGRPAVVSVYLLGFALLTLVTLPYWWARRHDLSSAGRLVLACFGVLLLWAFARAVTGRLPVIYLLMHSRHGTRFTTALVGREYFVVPVVTAAVTFLGAWGLALAVPRERRSALLWWGSIVLALSTLVAWPRSALATHSARLATGLGGAAVIHVALLLALGQLVGAALAGHRRVLSSVGAAICLLAILLSGSRAGLICLGCFVALLALWFALRGQRRLVLPLVGGLAAVVVVMITFVPAARHLVQGHDAGRTANLAAAEGVFRHGGHNALWGVGTGRVWPWYPFETGRLPIPWQQFIKTDMGLQQRTLTNPHSVFLAVFAELGLVGGALLVVALATLAWCALRLWSRSFGAVAETAVAAAAAPGTTGARSAGVREAVGALALVCTLPAFLFDYYLFKNFGITFWWWLVAAIVLGLRPVSALRGRVRPTDAVAGQQEQQEAR